MRILMLTQFYPPLMGGTEVMAQSLATALVKRGHHVAVATISPDRTPRYTNEDGIGVYRITGAVQRLPVLFGSAERPFAPPFPDPGLVMALRSIIREERPDIVHAHNWMLHSYLPLKQWSHAALVVSLHDYHLACPTTVLMRQGRVCPGPALGQCLRCSAAHYGAAKGLPTALLHRVASAWERRAVDMFLPVSYTAAVGSGVIAARLPYSIVPNFLDDNTVWAAGENSRYTHLLPDGEFIVFVGALNRTKGVETLIRAYVSLEDVPPLVLIGHVLPGDMSRLDSLPAGVRMLGAWPRSAIQEALRKSLFAVVPSIVPETFGMTALETMAAARPVIASRIGGLSELVVDGSTGLLVEPGDVSALRNAMRFLLSNPVRRHEMGATAKQQAQRYTASTVVPRLEQVYSGVLANRLGSTQRRGPNGHS